MSLDEAVKAFGAKGAVLDYIHNQEPSIPIEPYILVPLSQDWHQFKPDIKHLGDCLVRSSSPVEDGKTLSFAGLFWTLGYTDDKSVEDVLNSVRNKSAIRYAKLHGINLPIPMTILFQKKSLSKENWSMLRHPHRKQLILAMGKSIGQTYGSTDLVFDEKRSKVYEYTNFCNGRLEETHTPEDLPEAISYYKSIEKMSEFDKHYAYQMEFGTRPLSIYQFRPFRKKERATWSLNSKKMLEDSGCENFSLYSQSFGLTPPEGLELKLVRGLCARHHEKGISKLQGLLKRLNPKKPSSRLLRLFPESERVYAEELTRLWHDKLSYKEILAFDRAKGRLNAQSLKDLTLFEHKDMHFNYGNDVDLVFPNAKVLVAQGGLQFLSHGWFRAMQSYDIVLASYDMIRGETGDSVRVFSDGRKGLVLKI